MALVTASPATAEPGDPLYPLVDAAAERLQTADPVAASKWLTGAAISDPARVGQVLDAVTAQAEPTGLPAGFVTAVFTDQIDATEAIQYSRFSVWKFDPAAAPASAPDLAASRALIDTLNQRMVSQMAGQWALLRSAQCPAELDRARTEVARDRALDPLYQQALTAATRSYCTG